MSVGAQASGNVRGTPVGRSAVPASLEDAAAILGDAASRDETVAFRGGGTSLELGYPPERVDVLVSTERLTRVVDYAPADLVLEVEAGLTLAALQQTAGANKQRLALEVPYPELATLGGIVATNAFGPRRVRYGSLRDLIVGVSLVRADGSRARGGGKVVKNVAGFDLPKIMVGSLGTLAMIATVTLRLHPLPTAAAGFRVEGCTGDDLRALERAIVAAQLEPSAFLAERCPGGYRAHVLFEGFDAGVAEQSERFAALAVQLGRRAESEAQTLLATLDETVRTHGNVRVRFSVPPSSLSLLESEALAPLAQALADAKVVTYPSLGVAFVSGFADDARAAILALEGARRCAERCTGNVVIVDAPHAVTERVDVYGTLPASFALMRRLKERFDPARRLNRGRFLGGL